MNDRALAKQTDLQEAHTIVALSGGVDSSVAALLLAKGDNSHVSALFMKNWEGDDTEGYCASEADVADALDVCELLGLELNTVNLASQYFEDVFEPFLDDYAAGRTPNPDIECNRFIKFRAFLDHITEQGADYVATGHYAQRIETDRGFELHRGVDPGKDQSYFLYTLGQEALARVRFPIGHLQKTEVRSLARDAGLPTSGKKDSTGICFIGERNFRAFLGEYLEPRPGPIRTVEGQEIGSHQGLHFYTLGQRQGLGIGGVQGAPDAPWYVVSKQLSDNTLLVAQDHAHPLLLSRQLKAHRLTWVAGEPPETADALTAKVRYRQSDQACEIVNLEAHCLELKFKQAQRAVTPGQSVVLYNGSQCLGGAIITEAPPEMS